MFTYFSFKSFRFSVPALVACTGVSCDPWATTMRWWKLWSIWPIWRPWWCWNRWSVSLRFLSPQQKMQFRSQTISVHSSWKSLLWSYKAAQSGPNFLGKLEFVNIWLPGSLPGTWALSQIPTGTISFGRVKGAQKLSEGWMDVDGWEMQMRHPVQFSSVVWNYFTH